MNVQHFGGNFLFTPELRTGQSGRKYVNATLVVDDVYKTDDGRTIKEPARVEFTAYERQAELLARHFKTGDYVVIHTKMYESKPGDSDNYPQYHFELRWFDFPRSARGGDHEEESTNNTKLATAHS